MRFVRGVIIGTTIGAGLAMMYTEGIVNKKNLMKKGKQMVKKMGF